MQTSQKHHHSGGFNKLYHQPAFVNESYRFSPFQILGSNMSSDDGSQVTHMSFKTCNGQFFTLESSPAANYMAYDSPPSVSVMSNRSPFSSQGAQSYISDPPFSPENIYGSPLSMSSAADDDSALSHKMRELECLLLGPESDDIDSSLCSFNDEAYFGLSMPKWNPIVEMIPRDLKQMLVACAWALSDADKSTAAALINAMEQMVSISGEPIQRLGAYMLEGLKARLQSSGYTIYRSLKCDEPTSSELMSSMYILYQICPYWKFAYVSANVVIGEATENESTIHIIDFQIAQGSQWVPLIQALALRPGGPPLIRITGIDDSQSTHARGGGLHIVGERLSKVAMSCNVPFKFHDAAMSGCAVDVENLKVQPGEALVVNFPYVLHHMPDESVSTQNHRDQLLRLVKSLSPRVVTLVEQESNTNTTPFYTRFTETLDYYTAMFESIDVARPRNDKQRINAEQHCLARDIVNMVACEGPERVERHELFGKWRARFTMAGFTPYPLSSSVKNAVKDMLKEYHENYRVDERNGAVCLSWLHRALSTCSAWR